MSESDSKEKGNLKEERPKSSKASSKLHAKVEKEKETDQGKKEKETDQGKTKQKPSGLYPVLDEFKQKPSGLYPVLDEFADITLSDSAEDELDSEEEEDLEEAAAAYEQEREYPQVRIIHYMDDILLAAPSQVMLDKAYAHTVHALEKKGLYMPLKRGFVCVFPQDQENPIWILERLTRFIRHEDPDPDTSDKPDSSPGQSRTGDAVVGSDQNVADPNASAC
ncbi:hypothetical protein STEG23_035920 [Scotinomys teguina]